MHIVGAALTQEADNCSRTRIASRMGWQPASNVEQSELGTGLMEMQTPAVALQYGAVGGAIGGALTGLINYAEAKAAEKLLRPIRERLSDYDYAAVLKRHVETSLGGLEWLNVRTTCLEREAGESVIAEQYNASQASVLL